jgi:hypothetical protein
MTSGFAPTRDGGWFTTLTGRRYAFTCL